MIHSYRKPFFWIRNHHVWSSHTKKPLKGLSQKTLFSGLESRLYDSSIQKALSPGRERPLSDFIHTESPFPGWESCLYDSFIQKALFPGWESLYMIHSYRKPFFWIRKHHVWSSHTKKPLKGLSQKTLFSRLGQPPIWFIHTESPFPWLRKPLYDSFIQKALKKAFLSMVLFSCRKNHLYVHVIRFGNGWVAI